MPERYLITGVQGFLGARLALALLERGDEVVGWDLPRDDRSISPGGLKVAAVESDVEVIDIDIADRESVHRELSRSGGIDSVIHLAALTLVGEAAADPEGAFRVNAGGTWTLLEGVRSATVGRVLVASSDKAYGPSHDLPYREEQPLRPASPYEASKAACDVIARSYAPMYGLPVAVTRLANIYGGGDMNLSRLVPGLIVPGLCREVAVIRSDGSPERDFLHVTDAVEAYLAIDALLAAGQGHGEAFNAGSGSPVPVSRVVDEIAGLLPEVRSEFRGAGRLDGEIDRQFVDSKKLNSMTGWKPSVSIQEGLGQAIDWYRDHLDQLWPSRRRHPSATSSGSPRSG